MRTTNIVFPASFAALLLSACASSSDYAFSQTAARKAVLDYCRIDLEQNPQKPRLPYRATFERAMQGDIPSLTAIFTRSEYWSGDNESWSFTAWPLLHAVGDQRFAAFLNSVSSKTRADIFEQIFYEGSYYPKAIPSGYFQRHFPRVEAIYRHTKLHAEA
jgi:hypothetical protein